MSAFCALSIIINRLNYHLINLWFKFRFYIRSRNYFLTMNIMGCYPLCVTALQVVPEVCAASNYVNMCSRVGDDVFFRKISTMVTLPFNMILEKT